MHFADGNKVNGVASCLLV